MASNFITDTATGKSVSAYVILNKKGVHVATVHATWSKSGTCLVNVHDNKDGFQHAKRGGYGYDKFTSALSGMKIDGHEMSDHCGKALTPPKGRKLFPAAYKPRKGYTLANFTRVSVSGERVNRDYWQNKAWAEMGLQGATHDVKNERQSEMYELAAHLESTWRESDDCESGYRSCFRKSGLDYLNAIGYRVIQAI